MIDRKHSNLIRIDAVKDTVRKPSHNYPPNCRIDFPGAHWETTNMVESRFHAQEKFLAQALPFPVVPGFRIREILFCLRRDDQGQAH
jgi:hypothetical protein